MKLAKKCIKMVVLVLLDVLAEIYANSKGKDKGG